MTIKDWGPANSLSHGEVSRKTQPSQSACSSSYQFGYSKPIKKLNFRSKAAFRYLFNGWHLCKNKWSDSIWLSQSGHDEEWQVMSGLLESSFLLHSWNPAGETDEVHWVDCALDWLQVVSQVWVFWLIWVSLFHRLASTSDSSNTAFLFKHRCRRIWHALTISSQCFPEIRLFQEQAASVSYWLRGAKPWLRRISRTSVGRLWGLWEFHLPRCDGMPKSQYRKLVG